MSMFKVGDKVRFTRIDFGSKSFVCGHEYVVGGRYHSLRSGVLGVVCDEQGEENGYDEEYFDLVTAVPVRTETVTRMVIVPGDYEVYAVSRVHEKGVNLSVSDGLYDAKALRQFARGLVSMAEVLEQNHAQN